MSKNCELINKGKNVQDNEINKDIMMKDTFNRFFTIKYTLDGKDSENGPYSASTIYTFLKDYYYAKPPEEQKEMIQAVKEGRQVKKPIPEKPKEDRKLSEEDKELIREIKQDIKASRTYSTYIPTVDDFEDEFRNNSEPYISYLKRIIANYATIIKGNTDRIIKLIDECITSEVVKIKEEIINEYA